jgi:predicted phosphodiesterase
MELAGRKIFIVHYPHYARAMGVTGDWDLVCCGHDHRAEIDTISNIKGAQTLFVNPGTVAGVGAPPTYAMGDLAEMQFEIISVPVDPNMAYNMPHVTAHT